MSHDLVIRNGTIIDGTGAAAYEADLAVDGNSISAIGSVTGTGREEIDARGTAVTPGFIDLHTHLDAQVGWDPDLTSITWHGVTTALMGNCGVTFAPCKLPDREFLASMMETVEDIPKAAILSGLAWDWESYGGYLDSIERSQPMINIGGFAGHCAIRFYVMGERSVEETATPDELRQMAELAAASVRGGALGFSTNRHPAHRLSDGRCIPGTFVDPEEVRTIARAVGEAGGFMQLVVDHRNFDREMGLIEDSAALSKGALFNAGATTTSRFGEMLDSRVKEIQAHGHNVLGMSVPRAGGNLVGLFTPHLSNGRFRTDSWMELQKMSFDKRLEAIQDAGFQHKLVSEIRDHPEADQFEQLTGFWYPLGLAERPCYTAPEDESLLARAKRQGVHPVEVYLQLALASDGKMLIQHREFNTNLDTVAELLRYDWALPGMGDAGAHVGQMVDSGWSSFVLGHWCRDAGLYSVEEGIRRMTSMPAGFLKMHDRGLLETGKRADINVIDTDRVAEAQPQIVHDFPHGAPRFIQRAVGYDATICNGQVILRHDEHTGHRSGVLLRGR